LKHVQVGTFARLRKDLFQLAEWKAQDRDVPDGDSYRGRPNGRALSRHFGP